MMLFEIVAFGVFLGIGIKVGWEIVLFIEKVAKKLLTKF